LAKCIAEAPNIRLIKGRIGFVEDAEGARIDREDGEEECCCSEAPFTTREQVDVLLLLTGGTGDNLNSLLRASMLFACVQKQACRSTAKEAGEAPLKLGSHGLKRGDEAALHGAIQLIDQLEQGTTRLAQILHLASEEALTLSRLCILLKGQRVDHSQTEDPGLERLDRGL